MKKIMVILFIFMLTTSAIAPAEKKHDIDYFVELYLKNTAPFSIVNLSLAMELLKIHAKETVFNQIVHETGKYTSPLFRASNNLIGMKYAKTRETTAIGKTKAGYAIYDSWYSCLVDIKLFQEFYLKKGHDLSNYHVFLAKIGYAEDSLYIEKLRRIGN